MQFQLYLPAAKSADPDQLRAVGLADLAPGAQFTVLGVDQAGPGSDPDGNPRRGGALVHWPSPNPGRLGYRPDAQEWLPAMPLDGLPPDRYFVGIDKAHPPAPHELLKNTLHPGSPVGLGDGQLWMIPHASQLPFDIIRDPATGTVGYEPRPAFHFFWTKCAAWQRMFDTFREGDQLPPIEEQVEFLEEALRLNYRLTPEVISHLRLFSTGANGTLRACLLACLHVQPGE